MKISDILHIQHAQHFESNILWQAVQTGPCLLIFSISPLASFSKIACWCSSPTPPLNNIYDVGYVVILTTYAISMIEI